MMPRRLLLALVFLLPARAVCAQSAPPDEKVWISVNGGTQTGTKGFSDSIESPLYLETKNVETAYPRGGGVMILAGGGVRIWKQLSVGLGATRIARTADAQVSARLPHPFFDNQPRTVEGKVRSTREEVGAHVKIAWTVAPSPHLRVILSGGPSIISVRQTLVTDVNFSESYPYDTAAFTSATASSASKSATGAHAAADVFWLFSRHLGAGGVIQFSRASVKLASGSHTITIDAGGAQAGAGLRLVF
jgi:hypothetical protein